MPSLSPAGGLRGDRMIRHNGIEIDRERLIIRHRARSYRFRAHTARNAQYGHENLAFESISHIILHGPISKEVLFEYVYGLSPHGGPLDGIHIFDVRIFQWKVIFEHLDLELTKEKFNSTTRYTLTPKFNVQETAERILAVART
jgi:hypothetical protein